VALLTRNKVTQHMSPADPSKRIKRAAIRLVLNAASLFPAVYGLYCIVSLSGRCVAPQGPERTFTRWFALVPVEGKSAVLAGCGYIALGVFVLLSSSGAPSEDYTWRRRATRGVARWGSLVAMLWFWHKARPFW